MLMLIPLALITLVTVIILSIAQNDYIQADAAQVSSASRAIAFHHQIVLEQPITATGFLTSPAGSIFTAFEGLTTYAHIEDDTVFILTWPDRFHQSTGEGGEAASSHHETERVRSAMRRGGLDLAGNNALNGFTVHGDIERGQGAFELKVGPVMLAFNPPVAMDAPVILTILSGA